MCTASLSTATTASSFTASTAVSTPTLATIAAVREQLCNPHLVMQ
jgi:hypothetical protein